jgi:hypothetical protein
MLNDFFDRFSCQGQTQTIGATFFFKQLFFEEKFPLKNNKSKKYHSEISQSIIIVGDVLDVKIKYGHNY